MLVIYCNFIEDGFFNKTFISVISILSYDDFIFIIHTMPCSLVVSSFKVYETTGLLSCIPESACKLM